MWAEFKEKTYETAFVGELRLMTTELFAPDQHDENFLGFDAAAFLPWDLLDPFLPYMRRRRWHRLIGISASETNEIGKELNRRLPPFKMNLFIQFKRPEYLSRPNATEWEFWDRPYFRYWAEDHQQKLLETLAKKSNGRAAAVYAVPAFFLSDHLFRSQLDGTVIEKSNILNAELLRDHSRCTFAEAGNYGIGHSESENLESPSLDQILSETSGEELSFTRHLKITADTIKLALEADAAGRETLDLARRAIYGGGLDDLSPRAAGTWIDALLTIVAFNAAFGTRVCAIA